MPAILTNVRITRDDRRTRFPCPSTDARFRVCSLPDRGYSCIHFLLGFQIHRDDEVASAKETKTPALDASLGKGLNISLSHFAPGHPGGYVCNNDGYRASAPFAGIISPAGDCTQMPNIDRSVADMFWYYNHPLGLHASRSLHFPNCEPPAT